MSEILHVTTRTLDVTVRAGGPSDGAPVLLLHGFPDDARTWDAVAAHLHTAGFRTYAPYLRGFGPTAFRDADAPRSGEITALARDAIDLADALALPRAAIVGHDWGARAAYGAAVLAPQRFSALAALAVAYGTSTGAQRMDVAQTRAYWYQWYFATPRGAEELERNRAAFCRELWRLWSPGWPFDEADYDSTAASFDNVDFVPVVLSSYRQRWGFVPGAYVHAEDRAVLERIPPVTVPTLTLMGRDDGATLPSSAEGKERLFAAPYRCEILADAGHFVQRERPADVAERVIAHLRAHP